MAQAVSYGSITIVDTTDKTVYIAYASDNRGTDFSPSPSVNLPYVGINISTSQTMPPASDSGWVWSKYTGTDGVSITSVVDIYYLQTNTTKVSKRKDGTALPSKIDSINTWSLQVPTYVSNGTYWTSTAAILSSGVSPVYTEPVEDLGLTEANSVAQKAAEDAAQAVSIGQSFWWLPEDKTVGDVVTPAGAYITQVKAADFQQSPSGPNIFIEAKDKEDVHSIGIKLRDGLTEFAKFGVEDDESIIALGDSNTTHVKITDDEFGFYDKNRKVSFISADQGMSVQFPLRVGEHLEFTENQSYSLVTEKKIAEGETLYIKQEAGAGDEYAPVDNLKEYNFNHRLDDSAYKIYLKEEGYTQQTINNFINGVDYYKQAEKNYVLKEESNVIYGEVYYIQDGYNYSSIQVSDFVSGTEYYEEVDGEYQLTTDTKPVYGKEYYIESGDEGYALDSSVGFDPNLTYFYKNNNVYIKVVEKEAYVSSREYFIGTIKYTLVENIGFDPNLTYYKNIDNTYIEVENGEEFTNINYYISSEDVYKEVSTSEIYDENINYYFKESNNYVPIETYILPNNGIYLSTSEQTIDTTLYQLILGIYNEPNSDALLIIGNGSGESKDKRSNGLIIRKNGRLLISNNTAIQFKDSSGNIIEGAIFVGTNNNFYIGTPQISTRLRGKDICIENSSVFNEIVTFKKKMTVQSGGANIYGVTTLQSLIASGSTNLKSGLTVTGNSIFNNKLTIKGGLDVTGTLTTTSTILPGAAVRLKNCQGLTGYGTKTSLIYTIGYVSSSNKVIIGDSSVPLIIRGKNKGPYGNSILNSDGVFSPGSSIYLSNSTRIGAYKKGSTSIRYRLISLSDTNNVLVADADVDTYIYGKSITIGGRDASLFLNRGNITMDHHEVSTGTIKAKSYGEISKAFSKSGYYPYGIVGWYLVGSGQSYLNMYRLRLSNRNSGTATVECCFRNTMENTDFSGTLHVDILWIKIL